MLANAPRETSRKLRLLVANAEQHVGRAADGLQPGKRGGVRTVDQIVGEIRDGDPVGVGEIAPEFRNRASAVGAGGLERDEIAHPSRRASSKIATVF
jgi:hypothetical protein